MKQFIKHTPYLVSLLILLGITSCTKMDEYLKYTDGKEILYTGCTSLIMVDLFISNSCYVLTRNITNPGSCLLYYLLFLPPVYLFFSYSFNRLTLLFERRKKKGTHPFSSFYPASRAFLVFS